MLTLSLRLGITAALPPLAALLVYVLPRNLRLGVRLLGMLALAVCLGLLVSEASLVAAGGRLASSYGTPVGDVHLLLRADPQGVIVASSPRHTASAAIPSRRAPRRRLRGSR